jgi:A/G-specific adenine glycosylase
MKSSPKPEVKFSESLFRNGLLAWYDAHARDLPWRESGDPYRVWVSEVMLQQTRVAAVIEHYREFMRRFPTVAKLAAAREASVLAAWSGLGYYRRARMLHAAAKVVARERGGEFPRTADDWRTLPGVGRYTAAAIASIAFGEAVAVVDGNVERVLQRITGHTISGEQVWQQAENLLDRQRPGDFNQAIMELGATVCTPRAPTCLTCPLVELCVARGEMTGGAKKARQLQRVIHYALDRRNGSVFLTRRPADVRLMAGMWELPEIPAPADYTEPFLTVKHSITVTDYTVHVWPASAPLKGKWWAVDRIPRLALTGLARKILRKSGIIPASATSTKSSTWSGRR